MQQTNKKNNMLIEIYANEVYEIYFSLDVHTDRL